MTDDRRYRARVIPMGQASLALSFLAGGDSGGQIDQFVYDMHGVMWRGGHPSTPLEVQILRREWYRSVGRL